MDLAHDKFELQMNLILQELPAVQLIPPPTNNKNIRNSDDITSRSTDSRASSSIIMFFHFILVPGVLVFQKQAARINLVSDSVFEIALKIVRYTLTCFIGTTKHLLLLLLLLLVVVILYFPLCYLKIYK
jgi:hypothetical protein